MISYANAEKKILAANPGMVVFSSVDLDEEYVFILAKKGDKGTYHETRMSVDKKTGAVSDFFPRDIKKYQRACQSHMIKKPAIPYPLIFRR